MALVSLAVLLWPRDEQTAATPGNASASPVTISSGISPTDQRLQGAYRFERGGWVYVHLAGSPERIGFQHGYLLAPEIEDAFEAVKLIETHESERDWEFFLKAAREMLWPRIDPEYQEELKGIVEGLRAQGKSLDINDVVALNSFEELPGYYVPWYNAQHKVAHAPRLFSPGNCSALVATGSRRAMADYFRHRARAWRAHLHGRIPRRHHQRR